MSDNLETYQNILKGKGLKALRQSQGQTARSMAQMLGVSVLTYRNYEHDPFRMGLSIFLQLSHIFNLSLAELLDIIQPTTRGLENETTAGTTGN